MAASNQNHSTYQDSKENNGSTRLWMAASGAWIMVILFSSTSLASDYCERAFAWLYGSTVEKSFSSQEVYALLHVFADKGLHLALFFVLGILLWGVFTASGWRRVTYIVGLGLIVGTASEILQAFFPGRDPAVRDVLINMVGTLIGAAAMLSHTFHTRPAK